MSNMKERLANLIKARQGVIAIRTHEAERVMDILWEICTEEENSPKTLLQWSVSSGTQLVKWMTKQVVGKAVRQRGTAEVQQFKQDAMKYTQPPGAILAALDYKMDNARDVLVMAVHNFHHFMTNPQIQQLLIDASTAFLKDRRILILIGPVFNLPNELSKAVTIIDWPLPNAEEIRQQVEEVAEMARQAGRYVVDLDGNTQLVVRALQGMTAEEIYHSLNLCIVTFGKLDASSETLHLITERKAGIVKATRALEFFETNEQMSNVGGMEGLKKYSTEVAAVYSDEAEAFGAVPPRGVLLAGIPGTGKSLYAKCIASLLGVPLLRMDAGSLFSSLVGSSEENVRQALHIAEAVAPCVLWIDEVEKSMGGGQGGELDGGTSQRVFATLLTWMQERARAAKVFVVMTSNSVRKIDPALFQRVDQFAVDLPDTEARAEILAIHLCKNGRANWQEMGIDVNYLAEQTEGYSGRELEEAIMSGVRKAFRKRIDEGYEGDVTTEIIMEAASEIVPIVRTKADELYDIRRWAESARKAGRPSTYEPEGAAEAVQGFVNE